MQNTHSGPQIHLSDAISNFNTVHTQFKTHLKYHQDAMFKAILPGWLGGVRRAFHVTEGGEEAVKILEETLLARLNSSSVHHIVLEISNQKKSTPETKKALLRALQVLVTLLERTCHMAATKRSIQTFYKEVETWDPISAVAFIDPTNPTAKLHVLRKLSSQYELEPDWISALTDAFLNSPTSIIHHTSHPSSSFSMKTAQADSDLVTVLVEKSGGINYVEHDGTFSRAVVDCSDENLQQTTENLTLLLCFKGASPHYATPLENWEDTIKEHYIRHTRLSRRESALLLQYTAENKDSLSQDSTTKAFIRLLAHSLSEENNHWAPDLDSRPADIGAITKIKSQLTLQGLRHNQRLSRLIDLPLSTEWRQTLGLLQSQVLQRTRQSSGEREVLIRDIEAAQTGQEVLEAVEANRKSIASVYDNIEKSDSAIAQKLTTIIEHAQQDNDFLTEINARVCLATSRQGAIGEQVRFARDAMKGLIDALDKNDPIGNTELNRCLAILKLLKDLGLNMFVTAESYVEDLADMTALIHYLDAHDTRTHCAALRERPDAYSDTAQAALHTIMSSRHFPMPRALFVGDSDSRGDGEALAGLVTADTHIMASSPTFQSKYSGIGCSKSRGCHVEGGVGEQTLDKMIRDSALRVKDVTQTKEGYKISLNPIAYTNQPHRAIFNLTTGRSGEARWQSVISALFPIQRLQTENAIAITTQLRPVVDASIKIGESTAYNELAECLFVYVKDFMKTLAKRPNTRADYSRTTKTHRTEPTEPERFSKRVRAIQQAACEYLSPYQVIGYLRHYETFRYLATMPDAELDTFKHTPTGHQFRTLISRYPVLKTHHIDALQESLIKLGICPESQRDILSHTTQAIDFIRKAKTKLNIPNSEHEDNASLQQLEAKEAFANMIRNEIDEHGASDSYMAMMTCFLGASGA
jgi:beta-phosphoglucomutase-like phosphatase (HAD superfamily)